MLHLIVTLWLALDPRAIVIQHMTGVCLAPCDAIAVIHFERDPANRELIITLDCDSGYWRNSGLEGDQLAKTPVTFQIRWPGIPVGECEVKAVLIRDGVAGVDTKKLIVKGGMQ